MRGGVLVEDTAQRAVGAIGEGELGVGSAEAAAEVVADLAQWGEAQVEEAMFLDEDNVRQGALAGSSINGEVQARRVNGHGFGQSLAERRVEGAETALDRCGCVQHQSE
jgi:hypothetical protein